MKRHNKFPKLLFVPLLLLLSCADDANVRPDTPAEEFFMELKVGTSTYRVSNRDHEQNSIKSQLICADAGYVSGYDQVSLEDDSEQGFIRSLSFGLGKKVFKDELNLHNELSYTEKVVTAKTFGFPINTSGFYEVYDPGAGHVEVSRNASAEAYLWLNTADGVYRSTSVVPNTRDDSSFLSIDQVIENKGDMAATYPYIVEGTFMVNLFKGHYGTTSERVEGKFRWPVSLVRTSELVGLCR